MKTATLLASSAAWLWLGAATALPAAPAMAQPEASAAADDSGPAVEPEARQALDRMGSYLRTLQSFEVQADTTTDEVNDEGQKLQFGGSATYRVRRPDGFVVTTANDRKIRTLYYDGKSITLWAPRMNYYATVPAPPTIHETIDKIEGDFGIEFPMSDLFSWGTADDHREDLKRGFYVGYARISGADTDQYAFSEGNIDWQIWITRGAHPLPLKVVIVNHDDEAQPEFTAVLHWNTAAVFKADAFAFRAPADAKPITLAAADAEQ